MPSSLHLLPSSTIRSIASSQVISSVSCVVKELIENSLDAGASNIEVKLEEWGLEKIEVRDNGSGVAADDVPFVAQAHYTSKLKTDKDLEMLTTYGFRGEALGALCALSNVTILTKTVSDSVAISYTLDCSGRISATRPAPATCGTIVTACKLFKNMPVRKQFYGNLKKCKEEFKKVEDLVVAFGLIHPQLRILLRHNKSVVWQKSKVSSHKTALISVFGASTFSQMTQLQHVDQQGDYDVEILGFLPKAESDSNVTSRVTNDRCFIYVNERPVLFKQVLQLVKQYYSSVVQNTTNRYPIMLLSIKVPPDAVDVNLEPNKNTVLLKENDYVLKVITDLLEQHYCKGKENVLEEPAATKEKATNNGKTKTSDSVNSDEEKLYNSVDRAVLSTSKISCFGDVNVERMNSNRSDSKENKQHTCTGAPGNENSLVVNNILRTTIMSSESQAEQKSSRSLEKNGTDINSSSFQKCNSDKLFTENQLDWADDLFDDTSDIDFCTPSSSKSLLPSPSLTALRNSRDKIVKTPNSSTDVMESTAVEQEEFCQLTALNEKNNPSIKLRGELNQSEVSFQEFDGKEGNQGDIKKLDFEQELSNSCEAKKDSEKTSFEDNTENCTIVDWSRGHGLVDKQGKPFEPVQLLLPPSPAVYAASLGKPKSVSGKRKHSFSNSLPFRVAASPSKKIKTVAKVTNQPLITAQMKPAPSPQERRKLVPKVEVHFSIQELKDAYCQKIRNRSSRESNYTQLICRLEPWGVWLIKKGEVIECANQYRIQECILFHRLMKTYSFQRQRLERCIQLNESLVGGSEEFNILCNMEHETQPPDPFSYLVDKRLTGNGFDVRRKTDTESGEVKLELYGMTTDLPFYGVSDLAQLIDMIKTSDCSENAHCLSQCRPLKAVNFLKGEAVRLARKLGTRMTREEVKEILRMRQTLPDGTDTCIHGRPFFHTVAKMPPC